MQIQLCHLIIALVALLSYLPAATAAIGHVAPTRPFALLAPIFPVQQQPAATKKQDAIQKEPATKKEANAVTVEASTATSKSKLPVQVSVDKSRVRVGEPVRITLSPASLVANPRYTVTIDFGDRTPPTETHQPLLVHRYDRVGHYDVRVVSVVDSSPPYINQQRPSVSLSAAPTTAVERTPVLFNAQISFSYPNVKYHFVFGDGAKTAWQDSSKTTHAYDATGSYVAYVEIGAPDNGIFKRMGDRVRQTIQVVSQPPIAPSVAVDLIANPTTVKAQRLVTFNARVDYPRQGARAGIAAVFLYPNLQYRFAFGDGSPSNGWQNSPQTTHRYAVAGNYEAYVELGRLNNQRVNTVAASNPRQVNVISSTSTPTPTPTPSQTGVSSPSPKIPVGGISPSPLNVISPTPAAGPQDQTRDRSTEWPRLPDNLWKYLLLAMLIVVVNYQTFKLLFVPRPTFSARPDAGGSDVDEGMKPLAINAQLLLRPDIADAQYYVSTDEVSFVRSMRRGNV